MTDKTLCQAMNEYLKTRRNHAETYLLKKFMEYAKKEKKRAGTDTYIKEITVEDFKRFLSSLSDKETVSEAVLKDYRCRLKHFQEYIGLSEVVQGKKNHNPSNDECPRCHELEKKLAKAEQGVAEHRKTIDGMIEEKDKECSQCKKLAEKENATRASAQTIDKLTTQNKEKDGILDLKKAELESKQGEIASLKTDNEYLKATVEQQSHDKFLEENQYLKVQLAQKNTEIDSKDKRIREVEQLLEIEKRQKGEIVNRVLRTVREFKDYMPLENQQCKVCIEGFTIKQYVGNASKSMTNLEDYIKGLDQGIVSDT